MKTTRPTRHTFTAIATLVLASFSAHAADDGNTRAEVKAEAAAAVKAGTIVKGEGPAKLTRPMASDTTRAEIKAEAKKAIKAHKIGMGEGSPPVAKTSKGSDVTRAEVKAEAREAVKEGDIAKGPNVPSNGGVAKP